MLFLYSRSARLSCFLIIHSRAMLWRSGSGSDAGVAASSIKFRRRTPDPFTPVLTKRKDKDREEGEKQASRLYFTSSAYRHERGRTEKARQLQKSHTAKFSPQPTSECVNMVMNLGWFELRKFWRGMECRLCLFFGRRLPSNERNDWGCKWWHIEIEIFDGFELMKNSRKVNFHVMLDLRPFNH